MNRTAILIAAGLSLSATLHAIPAQALTTRTFIASFGADTGGCGRAAPCRTLTYAYGQTSPGGEINILDAAGFGTLNITGSISIIGNGTAGILVPSGGTGITINAGASDAVNLRGLNIEGAGVGGIGIQFLSGKSLVVENCVARNLTFSGLVFIPSSLSLTSLSVSNSYFLDNAANGILVQTGGSGPVTAVIDRVVFYDNGFAGLNVFGTSGTGLLVVTVTDSVAGNNVNGSNGTGFLIQSTVGHSVSNLAVTHSVAHGNIFGISAFGANATVRVAQSTVMGNVTGYSASSSGVILSYGDNYIDANTGNTGTLGSALKQ
ncbi:MAG: hypothetical protein QOG83_2375 [Alphaproteobacteria bacterium]|jgi:hypothetical protein|nr:hypothetical protein [Alphaproteobacteria bacterium]